MPKRNPRRTDKEWLDLIQECRSSGLSDKCWCQEHHIHTSNFYYQIRRLRQKACEIPEPVHSSFSGKLMVFGFIKGFQPIAGYSYGAKNFKRLNESIKTSILWSTVFCALFGLILILFPATIISKFTAGDMELVRIGQASLRANGFSIMLFGFYTVYSSLFLALGKGLEGFILGACRQGICFVPIILLLPSLVGISGILYAQPIADLISAIITVFMAINLHKSLEKERLSYIKNVE